MSNEFWMFSLDDYFRASKAATTILDLTTKDNGASLTIRDLETSLDV